MSVSSTEHLDKLAFILYDRPSGRNIIGYAIEKIERLRADNERLHNEDTKTRHALKGWVYVPPDGGDEPTHERVAAVVAEVERLRAEMEKLRADIERIENDAWLDGAKHGTPC